MHRAPYFTHHLALPTAFLLLLFLPGCANNPGPSAETDWKQISLSGATMGTSYHVKVVVPSTENSDSEAIKQEIDSDLADFNKLLSTYDPDSELSRFNQHRATDPFPVSPQTLKVVRAAYEIYNQSGGVFDPSVSPLIDLWGFGSQGSKLEPPSAEAIEEATSAIGMNRLVIAEDSLSKEIPDLQLNLSAIAKGYGVDVIANVLFDEGFEDLMVEIGGEVVVRGKNLKRQPWTIGVDSPNQSADQRNLIETLSLDNCAVATSGDYRNAFEYNGRLYSHIIDPRTGWPIPESVKSVTVIAPTCMVADGAATAIMAMGAEKGLKWAEERKDLEALVFVKDDEKEFERLQTSGMENYLSNQN